MLVLCVIWAILAAVDTIIGQIKRSKHNDTVAVELLLDLFCQLIDLLILVFQFAV